MINNIFVRIVLGTVVFLMLPLGLTLINPNAGMNGGAGGGFDWSPGDFVFAFILIAGTASVFELARRKATSSAYKIAAGLALLGTFLLIWVNGAVGIIGDSDVNALYGFVVLTLLFGAIISRFQPQGSATTLFAAAAIQFIIPIIAYFIHTPDFSPGVMQVFMLNAGWVALFLASAIFFRQASQLQYA
jgi:hypothetical protein